MGGVRRAGGVRGLRGAGAEEREGKERSVRTVGTFEEKKSWKFGSV